MNLALPDHLVPAIASALSYGIADLQQAVTRDSPEVQQTVREWQTALALVARIQPVEDTEASVRVKSMTDAEIAAAIDANHPVTLDTDLCYSADALAMHLIHGRHDKREIVNLIRWCLLGCPTN